MTTTKRTKKPVPRKSVAKKIKQKKHPQFFIDSMGVKKTLYVIIKNGIVEDIVKVACPEIGIEIHDYDVETTDLEESGIFLDKSGKEYKRITLE